MNSVSLDTQLLIQNEGKIYGFDTAMKWLMEQKDKNVQPTDILLDFKQLLDGINNENMFSKFDSNYIHRHAFEIDEETTELDIKLGGKILNLRDHSATKLTTISSVILSKEIITLCSDKEIASIIANHIKIQHKKSFQEGSKIKLSLKKENQ